MKKKLLITGCNGQLGRSIDKLYENDPVYETFHTDYGVEGVRDLDITDLDSVMQTVREVKPYALINCAALTNVDGCETQTDAAYKINAIGPRNLSIAARECGAKLVHISTDYVFPGTSPEPLTEFDPTGPRSAYGRTKLAGEEFVRQFADRYFIIRTAWLYGDGKNFVKTMLKLSEDHKEVRVVSDQFGTPTSTAELVKAIDSLLFTNNYGTYHATCAGRCSWADFAEEIFRIAGKDTKVIRVSTDEYGAAAPRPLSSVLENYMLRMVGGYEFRDWHDALADYMKELGY